MVAKLYLLLSLSSNGLSFIFLSTSLYHIKFFSHPTTFISPFSSAFTPSPYPLRFSFLIFLLSTSLFSQIFIPHRFPFTLSNQIFFPHPSFTLSLSYQIFFPHLSSFNLFIQSNFLSSSFQPLVILSDFLSYLLF